MGVRSLYSDVYLETDKKGKWQRDDYDGPGEGGKKSATNSNADVVVVSYEKGGRERKKKSCRLLICVVLGTFFSLFEFMANENQANHTVKWGHCVFIWILCGPFNTTTMCLNIKKGFLYLVSSC